MKKIILFAALGLALTSCKKSAGNIVAVNTITATVDNKNYVFDQQPYNSTAVYSGQQSFGASALDSNTDGIELDISSLNNILLAAKTYGLQGDSAAEGDIEFYDKSAGIDYYNIDNSVTRPFTIKVTSVTNTSIEGTFSGVAYANRDTTLAQVTIINGRFNIIRY